MVIVNKDESGRICKQQNYRNLYSCEHKKSGKNQKSIRL